MNNRQSGFRYEMIDKWKLPRDTEFVDGTYRKLSFDEMGDCRVDIVGYSGGKEEVLIEVKAGRREELQPSQMKDGEYGNTYKNHNTLKLFFIIPDEYEKENDITPDKTGILKWSDIYNIALEHDNTGLAEDIKFFVENNYSNLEIILSKGDVFMYCNPDLIGKVISLYLKISKLMENFTSQFSELIELQNKKYKYYKERDEEALGTNYKITNGYKSSYQVW